MIITKTVKVDDADIVTATLNDEVYLKIKIYDEDRLHIQMPNELLIGYEDVTNILTSVFKEVKDIIDGKNRLDDLIGQYYRKELMIKNANELISMLLKERDDR